MELLIWIGVFLVSLFFLMKGADFFIRSAQQIGTYLGMSPFVIGVLIVGIGTSLPEFASAIAAVVNGATEIVVANAVGSNIANILLVIGFLATVAGRVCVGKDLTKHELPIFVIATAHFLAASYDGIIEPLESMLLVGTYVVYIAYLLFDEGEAEREVAQVGIEDKPFYKRMKFFNRNGEAKLEFSTFVLLIFGLAGVIVGAEYLVESVLTIAGIVGLSVGVISISAIAIGTSLPEVFVSLKALKDGEADLAVGNIFGSNAFNLLMAVGFPGLFSFLTFDKPTFELGVPILAVTSLIFFVAIMSRCIHRWEGMMMLIFYVFFMLKLFV